MTERYTEIAQLQCYIVLRFCSFKVFLHVSFLVQLYLQALAAYTQSHGEEMAQIQIESDGVVMKK